MAKKRGNNEGTIYQRSNGTYRAQISLNGKRLSFTGETHKACLKWIRKMSTQIDEGMTYEGAKTTLEKFFREWLVMKSTTVRLSTERQYKQIGRDYILPELGSIELLKLKPDQIQTLYNKHIKSGASPRTVELFHAVLRGCLNHAVKLGLISRNPTKAVVPPKPKPKEKLILDENQIQALLIAAKEAQPAYLPLYQLAITTGMRLGELLGITWDDLDWDKHTLTVNRQLKRIRREGLRLTPPKTKAGRRTLKIGRTTRSLLKEHQKAQFESTVPRDPAWTDKALVFAEEDGSPIGPRKMQKAFKRALAAAGLPDIRFHDLRHTAATHMLANGVDVLTVSRRLGHTKASTTLDIYGHAVPGLQEKAATIMNEITTPVALPDALSSSKLHRVAPGLHQEGKS